MCVHVRGLSLASKLHPHTGETIKSLTPRSLGVSLKHARNNAIPLTKSVLLPTVWDVSMNLTLDNTLLCYHECLQRTKSKQSFYTQEEATAKQKWRAKATGKGNDSHGCKRGSPAIRWGRTSPELIQSPGKRRQPGLPLPLVRETTGAVFGSSWQLRGREKQNHFKYPHFPSLKMPSREPLEDILSTCHGSQSLSHRGNCSPESESAPSCTPCQWLKGWRTWLMAGAFKGQW